MNLFQLIIYIYSHQCQIVVCITYMIHLANDFLLIYHKEKYDLMHLKSHRGNYQLDYYYSGILCSINGARLATYAEVEAAQQLGIIFPVYTKPHHELMAT